MNTYSVSIHQPVTGPKRSRNYTYHDRIIVHAETWPEAYDKAERLFLSWLKIGHTDGD